MNIAKEGFQAYQRSQCSYNAYFTELEMRHVLIGDKNIQLAISRRLAAKNIILHRITNSSPADLLIVCYHSTLLSAHPYQSSLSCCYPLVDDDTAVRHANDSSNSGNSSLFSSALGFIKSNSVSYLTSNQTWHEPTQLVPSRVRITIP